MSIFITVAIVDAAPGEVGITSFFNMEKLRNYSRIKG